MIGEGGEVLTSVGKSDDALGLRAPSVDLVPTDQLTGNFPMVIRLAWSRVRVLLGGPNGVRYGGG